MTTHSEISFYSKIYKKVILLETFIQGLRMFTLHCLYHNVMFVSPKSLRLSSLIFRKYIGIYGIYK